MNILITGGIGFIGSYFAEEISKSANKIIILDNFTGHSEHAHQLLSKKNNIEIYEKDIVNDDITNFFSGVDFVYHFAANSKISEGVNNPNIDLEITVIGTHNVLTAMTKNGVKHITYTSGSGVYGDQGILDLDENFGPLLPVSYYGASKLSAEAYISAFCLMNGMKAHIFRFANVVGYRQTHGVAFDFFYKLKKNPNLLEILGDGTQSKSYIDVSDIYQAVSTVMNKQSKQVDIYNVSSEDYLTVNEIAEIGIEIMNLTDVRIIRGKDKIGWKGDVPKVRFNSEKLKLLGWNPAYSSREATIRAFEYLINHDNF